MYILQLKHTDKLSTVHFAMAAVAAAAAAAVDGVPNHGSSSQEDAASSTTTNLLNNFCIIFHSWNTFFTGLSFTRF